MSFTQPAALELRLRAIKWHFAVMYAPFSAGEQLRLAQYLVDVFCVVGPVCRDVQSATGRKPVGDKLEKAWGYDTTLVMPFFWPGIREIEVESCE